MHFPLSAILVMLISTPKFAFNNLVRPPPCIPVPQREPVHEEEAEGLLSGPLDETAALPADLGQSGYDVVPEGEHAQADRTARSS